MKALLILMLLSTPVLAEDAYFYGGLGLGHNDVFFDSDRDWNDQGELGTSFRAGYRHRLTGNWYADWNYTHNSQLMAGKPFNDGQSETSSDHLYLYVEYRFND